jgi:hypothetical protein
MTKNPTTMKKSITLISMVLLLLITQRCAEDQTLTRPGSVQFALRLSSKGAETGKRAGSDIHDANAVFITVRKSSGEIVYTRKKIDLLKLGNNLVVSEPLQLAPGDYDVTEFMLAELGYIITFATPLEGSDLAEFVSDPLPIHFTVNGSAVTSLDVEVIDTTLAVPEAFGYVTFGVAQVPQPIFQLAIFKPEGDKMVLSGGQVYIIYEGDTIINQSVGAVINTFSFLPEYEPDAYYELIIQVRSHRTTSRFFTIESLEDLQGAPWTVTLAPALTMTTVRKPTPYTYSFNVRLQPTVTPGTIEVNWGENHYSTWVYTSDFFEGVPITHQYLPGSFDISVTRGIGRLEDIESIGINSDTRDIGLAHLPNLRYFALAYIQSPDTIDISQNLELLQINLAQTNIRWLDISHNALLKDINLMGATNLSAAAVNKLIDDLYQKTLTDGSWGGHLQLGETPDANSTMIGPPSATSLQKLRVLRDTYGWLIYPLNF